MPRLDMFLIPVLCCMPFCGFGIIEIARFFAQWIPVPVNRGNSNVSQGHLFPSFFKILYPFVVFCTVFMVRFLYRVGIRPWLHGGCRFHPSCSAYCIQALEQHRPIRAIILILWRIARCNPWGKCGIDPVPPSLFSSS